eukprot:3075753-Prymnesium_polylepis.5
MPPGSMPNKGSATRSPSTLPAACAIALALSNAPPLSRPAVAVMHPSVPTIEHSKARNGNTKASTPGSFPAAHKSGSGTNASA